jgi:hypothetical protein
MSTFNKKKFNNINYLGHVPFNPDLILDKRRFFDRPVGIFYQDLINMYWNIRSFKVNISIQTVANDDPLTTFFLAGGTSGGLAGALGGLAAVTQSAGRSPGTISINGYTKITHRYQKTIRNKATNTSPFEGIRDGVLNSMGPNLEGFEKDESVKENPAIATIQKPDEASLCVPGPIHRIIASSGGQVAFLTIDFSDIVYFQRKYWPKIIFSAVSGDSRFSTNPFMVRGFDLRVNGGISFMGYSLPIFGDITFSASRLIPPFALVAGRIVAGDRCCDRFFYDGFDAERERDCEEECGDGPKGVYREEKAGKN